MRILAALFLCILLLMSLGLYQCVRAGRELSDSLEPQRNAEFYVDHLTAWEERAGAHVTHFPEGISDLSMAFYSRFQRGFLQGGSSLHLGLELSESDYQGVIEAYADTPLVEPASGEVFPAPRLFTIDENGARLDLRDDYTYKYLGAENTSDLDYWNHGYIYGVAISQQGPRVIYFVESW